MTTPHPAASLVCVGVRGSGPGDPIFDADLDACAEVGIRAIILFDVDVPTRDALIAAGASHDDATRRAPRNILSPDQTCALIQHIRERLAPDCIVAIDQEGGSVARLTPRRGFEPDPAPAALATRAPEARAAAHNRCAARLARLGFDLNLAPCIDLAPATPTNVEAAHSRSYATDPETVAQCARECIDAHNAHNVATCIKHFPGLAGAHQDTHFHLADITNSHDSARELDPYTHLLDAQAAMVAHVLHRTVDPDFPATLSRAWINQLRTTLAYPGVIITDSIDMRAVSDRWPNPEATVRALAAGVDMVLHGFNGPGSEHSPEHTSPHPAPRMVRAILEALDQGDLTLSALHASADRIDRLRRRQLAPDSRA